MHHNEIEIGGHYHIRVHSDEYAVVEVLEAIRHGAGGYIVRRTDTGAILRKPRGAGALHDTPGPWVRYGGGAGPRLKGVKVVAEAPPRPAVPLRTIPPKATKPKPSDGKSKGAASVKEVHEMRKSFENIVVEEPATMRLAIEIARGIIAGKHKEED